MYGYEWTQEYGIYRLSINSKVEKEIRPVFKEELDFFGMDAHWHYPDTTAPILWAEGIRRYILNGECVAEAKGGGFYTKPTVEVYKPDLTLQAVDIEALWAVNEQMMKGLEQKAITFIRDKYEAFKKGNYAFVVAFSGGKDSLVLLDLVSKALSPNEFYVIFSNTGMELDCTLESVRRSERHWSNLRFHWAESHLSPNQSWDEFGPPGRRMRWCCAVHKSVPTILKLRELTRNYDVKAVVFDGVRAEESHQRGKYDDVSVGDKNINQINCRPIFNWNTAEIYIYLLKNKILINDAYRLGLFRVGCKVCPLASLWWEGIVNNKYPDQVQVLLEKIEKYAAWTKVAKERRKFIETGGWKARMGGKGLQNGENRIFETIENDIIQFSFVNNKHNWLDIAPLLGPIVGISNNKREQIIDHISFVFQIDNNKGLTVSYTPYSQMDRYIISSLRGVAYKAAYCIGCKACMVECPTSAFKINEEGKIVINESLCVHCNNCINFVSKSCLVAKSLHTSQGGANMNLVGLDRYKHFGLRKAWLEHYFNFKSDCFTMGQLGNRQYDSLKVWLREGGLLSAANKGEKAGKPTQLFEKIEPLGPFNPLTWAIIWANLAYKSTIVKWYMLYAPAGETYEKNDLIFMLGDDYSLSTRDNAVTALFETLRHSPIGSVLKQGIPISIGGSYKFMKQGWETPEAVAILYALYLWAEATGRYTFTLSQLEQARGNATTVGMDPVSIYGINPETFKGILQELALHYEKYIRVTFVADLDNIKLFPEYNSLDIIDIALN